MTDARDAVSDKLMNVGELIAALQNFPADMEVSFWCPDGYSDCVQAVEADGEEVRLTGYQLCRRAKPTG